METILDIHKIPNLHNVLATAGNIASLDSQEENSDKILHNCYGVVPKGLLTFLGFFCGMQWLVPVGHFQNISRHLGLFAGLISNTMGYCIPIVLCEMTGTK